MQHPTSGLIEYGFVVGGIVSFSLLIIRIWFNSLSKKFEGIFKRLDDIGSVSHFNRGQIDILKDVIKK